MSSSYMYTPASGFSWADDEEFDIDEWRASATSSTRATTASEHATEPRMRRQDPILTEEEDQDFDAAGWLTTVQETLDTIEARASTNTIIRRGIEDRHQSNSASRSAQSSDENEEESDSDAWAAKIRARLDAMDDSMDASAEHEPETSLPPRPVSRLSRYDDENFNAAQWEAMIRRRLDAMDASASQIVNLQHNAGPLKMIALLHEARAREKM